MASVSRSRKRRAEDHPALPDLSAEMSLSALRQLPAAALRQYADLYNLPGKGTKQTVSQRLFDHLQAQRSDSISNSAPEESPEGERSPSRPTTSRSDQEKRHSRRRRHSRPISPSPPGSSPARTKRSKHHHRGRRPSSSSSSSSTTESSSSSRSSSSSSSSAPPRRRLKHRRHYSSSSSSSSPTHKRRRGKHTPSKSRRSHHKHPQRRRHYKHHYSSTVPIPHKVQVAIERGEFVDLSDLLCEHLTMAGKSTKSRRATQSRCITNLDTWLEAWSLYATVLVTAEPHLAPDLFKYQGFITRTSRRFQTYAWLQYDSQFRLKLAANPTMRWSVSDPELIATWLSADATKIKQPCFTCGSPDHFAPNCPLKAPSTAPGLRCPVCNKVGHSARECSMLSRDFRSQPRSQASSHQGAPDDDKYCRVFNKRGFCFRGPRCPYPHVCSVCLGGHPQRACPKQTQ